MSYIGYAVELYFDPPMTASIRTLWDAMRATCGSAEVGVHPHISLAVVEAVQLEPLRALMQTFAQRVSRLPIQLDAIGTFPTAEGVVYLAPVVTMPLLELHDDFHRQLTVNRLTAYPYYRPGRWIPHCTVGIQLPPDKIAAAITLCRQSHVFQSGELIEMSLVELPAVRELARFPLTGKIGEK